MFFSPEHRRPKLFFLPLAGTLFLAGCAPSPSPLGVRPDPAAVKAIMFRIAPENMDALPPEQLHDMAEQVSGNLGTWGYAVAADDARRYSHILEARVGAVALKSTPPGFSFTLGNSDPRAMDFQKADVLPVDCLLYPAGRPADQASMYMDFVAGEKLKNPDALETDAGVRDTYVNHIATVCFNLLDDLKVPRKQTAKTATATPAWVPEVRIEVVDKPAAGKSAVPAAKPLPAPIPAIPARPLAPAPAAPQAAPAAAPKPATASPAAPATESTVPETPPVQTETRPGEGRKQVIIHNQGAPVILEFGYERK